MIRVVMAGPLPPSIGGMATVIDDISRSSLAREVELVLFDTGKRTPEERSLLQAIRTRVSIWGAWWRALEPGDRTIAHIHTCSGLTFFLDGALTLMAHIRGIPVVLHIHGARFDEFLDSLRVPVRWLARKIATLATRVVVLSGEWEVKLHTRLPGASLVVIENGVVEPPHLAVDKKPGELIALFLGNLCQRKGVWDLVKCASRLPPHVRLVFVGGEEDPGIAGKVRAELTRLGLEGRVELVGPARGDEKSRWLRRADIFVLPSYAEGVPISMLEALASGLPAVVTPVGGIPSVLRAGEHAFFVAPGDPRALADAITRLATDPQLRLSVGEAARRHVLSHYGIECTARKYMKLYECLRPGLLGSHSVRGLKGAGTAE